MKKIVAGIFLVALLMGNAWATVIFDHFENKLAGGDVLLEALTVTSASGDKSTAQSGLSNVLGGDRDTLVHWVSGNVGAAVTAKGTILTPPPPTQHKLSFSNDDSVKSTLTLSYGTYSAGGTQMDADATPDLGLVFDIATTDLAGSVSVLMSTHNGASTFSTSFLPIVAGGTGMFIIYWADFTTTPTVADLDDIDGLKFIFDSTVDSWDYSIDALRTTDVIPEPATMSLLGLGLLAIARRRRKRH
jgi:hypothetical protein